MMFFCGALRFSVMWSLKNEHRLTNYEVQVKKIKRNFLAKTQRRREWKNFS